MASATTTPGTEAANQVVGKVVILYGNVKAVSVDGTTRVLGPNSPIYAYDSIITESDGRVSITLNDPAHSQLDIGRMSSIAIDEDIFVGFDRRTEPRIFLPQNRLVRKCATLTPCFGIRYKCRIGFLLAISCQVPTLHPPRITRGRDGGLKADC